MALPYTREQLADKALNIAAPDGSEDDITVPEIMIMIDEACQKTCDMLIEAGTIEDITDSTITSAITSGLGTISEDVYIDTLKDSNGGIVELIRTDMDTQPNNPIGYMADMASLRRQKAGGEEDCYFTIRGSGDGSCKIYVYSAMGTPVSGSLAITAARRFTFADFPSTLADMLITILGEMAKNRLTTKSNMNK